MKTRLAGTTKLAKCASHGGCAQHAGSSVSLSKSKQNRQVTVIITIMINNEVNVKFAQVLYFVPLYHWFTNLLKL